MVCFLKTKLATSFIDNFEINSHIFEETFIMKRNERNHITQ